MVAPKPCNARRVRPVHLEAAVPFNQERLLDPLEARQSNPALVRPNANVSPFAEDLTNRYFRALVNSEEVGA